MKWSWKHSVSVLAVGLLLAACGGGSTTAPTTGTVNGTLARAADQGPSSVATAAVGELADIVPGQVFVAFERGRPDVQLSTNAEGVAVAVAEGFSFGVDGDFTFQGAEFNQLRAYPTKSGLSFYEVPGLDAAATRALVNELRSKDSVKGAFPNWILTQQQVTPDDPVYAMQAWHYEALNLPAAWAIEDGTSAAEPVPVAVLDTGAFVHPDMEWATVGANFVNWALGSPAASEGTIENFYTNAGGSDHGTHVAATIAALTDNGLGVAGVNWNVVPTAVKVLGASGGGSFAGIIEGVYWAAGDEQASYGGHVNPFHARVINMSLGGLIGEACSPELDELFQEVYAMSGAITVVAAGNDAGASEPYFPASCDSVITVGASGITGARAWYSNYGPYIDVMAPGGDSDYDHPADSDYPATVVSATVPWQTGVAGYGFKEGTSMASPHVAGVVSLMLAQEPDLTLDEVRQRLHDASMPLTLAECNVPASGYDGLNLCGAGLLDAEAALLGTNLSADQLGAVIYAVRYEETAPTIRFGDLGSLENLAGYSTNATANTDGSWSYQLADLPAGDYLMVGIEQRDPAEGVGTLDRFGVAEVTVTAGQTSAANIEATPVWMIR